MRHVFFTEDLQGDVAEVHVYCSPQCVRDAGLNPEGNAWPAPEAADYDQHCPQCGRVTVAAIGTPSFDGWPVREEN